MNLIPWIRHVTNRVAQDLATRFGGSVPQRRLIRGTFWALAGTITSRLLSVVAVILVARVLGKESFGEWGIIQSTVGMLGTLAGFGMGTTAARYVAELRQTDSARAGRIIALLSVASWISSLLLAVPLVVSSSWLSSYALGAPQLTPLLRLSAALLVLSGVSGAQVGVLLGFEAFKATARVNFLTALSNLPLTSLGALLFGVNGLIWGAIVAQALGCVLNVVALRNEARRHGISISYASCGRELPLLWQFSTPAVLTQLVISGVNWLAAALLVRQPDGLSEMGVFNAANQCFNAVIWLPYIVNSVSLPLLAERVGSGDQAGAIALLKTTVRLNAIIVLPVLAVGCLLSRYIMLSYGSSFEHAWPTLVVMLLNAGLLAVVMPVGQVMSARGHMWLGFFSNVVWGFAFLGTYALLSEWLSFGLALSRLLAYSMHAVFIAWYATSFINDARYRATPQAKFNEA